MATLALGGCAVPASYDAAQVTGQAASPNTASNLAPIGSMDALPPPRDALAFDDAVDKLTLALFARAKLDGTFNGRTLVIDPPIDRASGNQAVATRSMEGRMVRVVRDRFGAIKLQPLSAETLRAQPLVLAGSITPVVAPGSLVPAASPTRTYRIWAVLADLRTNRVIANETAWVRADAVDMTPTPFFRDSPSWAADAVQAAYLKTSAALPGDAVDPAYLASLPSSGILADGVRAYEGGRHAEALSFFQDAKARPAGSQFRALNGIYLANAALGRTREAGAAFGDLVGYGLERGKLAVKFVFSPNSTGFLPDQRVSGDYPMWLSQIAERSVTLSSCLRLVGHTSRSGAAPINQALSLARASLVRTQLVEREPPLSARIDAQGRGSAEPLVGSGRDDATDALDNRVEFETRPCKQAGLGTPRQG